ncbi:uncharacterized protein MONOS_12151 [Monocercomonoides exilis]|uniref:uncharacterized protein n=1 Tax=Monocercomonoides exilis TaxID=2049356 RepID=UPI0035594239|nr:hypothetical protein MONOS_12151 [Monocercomonoides exilis]|eukprot:MONOS_12151.1-p1 / transcript=MONOS_12151.1 / gene=MONOS_12151 / organism=Monocercomonoides_exilis_PA203 / gene_product=unspecified product / transcript_product=unspecified product / location=Mono_scaffold00653:6541-8262(-) / protein_length=574 / sequence_SO=supercontig / SO=protein_coding / is_pseudo=false
MKIVFVIIARVLAVSEVKEASAKEMCELDKKVVFRLPVCRNDICTPENNQFSKILSEFVAVNCSVSTASVLQIQLEGKACFFVCERSTLNMRGCVISVSSNVRPFAMDGGSINSVNLSLSTVNPFEHIPQLFSSSVLKASSNVICDVSLSDSSFSSFELSSVPFLSQNISCFVNVTRLKMVNISVDSGAQRELDLRVNTETMIESCIFSKVSDVIYGGIVKSMNTPSTSLTVLNSSFECCSRLKNVNESHNHNMTKQTLEENETHSFSDCEWHNPGFSPAGSAIYLNGNSTLVCVRCSFINMSHNIDGAVCIHSATYVKLSCCSFVHCVANSNTGGMIMYHLKGDYNISECSFYECMCINAFSGGLRIFHPLGNTNATIEKCKFFFNQAASYGGGLYIEQQQSPYLITECEFEGNKANGAGSGNFEGGGGGIFMRTSSWMETDSTPERIAFCFFTGNKARNEEGHDVKIKNECLKSSPFKLSYTTSPANRVFYNNSQTNYDEWLPTVRTTYTSATGVEGPVCGLSEGSPCNTIEQAFNMIEKGAEGTVNILRSSYSSKALFIEGGDISFKGES